MQAVALSASLVTIACLGALRFDFIPDIGAVRDDWHPAALDLSLSTGLPLDQSPNTIAPRPLFSPLRRPPAPRPEEPQPQIAELVQIEPPPPPSPPPQFVLKGVLFGRSRQAALIQSPNAPDGKWVILGKELDGWTITRIRTDGVDLESAGQKASFALYVDNRSN